MCEGKFVVVTIREILNPRNWWAPSGGTVLDPANPVDNLARLDELLFTLNSGEFSYSELGTVAQLRAVMRRCSPIPAIVSQKAFALAKGTVTVWNPNTEKPVRGQFKEWDKLFRQPNKLQTQRQFIIQGYSYVQTYGYAVVEPVYPSGFNDRPTELRILRNWLIDWEWDWGNSNTAPRAAWYNENGIRRPLNLDTLIIIRDPSCTDYQDNGFLPLSRAADLESEIGNFVANMQVRGQMVTDRGSNGILSNSGKDSIGAIPMDATEKDRVQQAYRRYGNMKGQDKIIVTDAALSYTPMTFDVEQLGLHPEHIAVVKAMCNRYAFPFQMLAEGHDAKYNNSGNGRRDFQDTTIEPESLDFFEQLSQGLKMYEQGCEVYIDYSGVASLQMSQKDKGQGREAMNKALKMEWDNGLITRNEWLDELGRERIVNPLFDKYKWELTPEELGVVVDNQNNSNDGSEEANAGRNQGDNGEEK